MLSLIRRRVLESKRLPAGYQEVEWVSNPNGISLQTNVMIKSNWDGFEVTFKYSEFDVEKYAQESPVWETNICGCYVAVGANGTIHFLGSRKAWGFFYRSPGAPRSTYILPDTNIHTAKTMSNKSVNNTTTFTLDNDYTRKDTNTTWNDTYGQDNPWYIFSSRVNYKAALRGAIYSFKTFDKNGVQTSYLVPCVRKSDNAAGFYDLYAGDFIGNTSLVAGPIPGQELPYGVTAVEWLESTGTQYIDTGVIPTADTRFVVDGTISSTVQGHHGIITIVDSKLCRFHMGNAGSAFGFGIGEVLKTTIRQDDNRHTLEMRGNGVAVLDSIEYEVSDGIVNANYPIFIYARNSSGTPATNVIGKVYSSQIYESGVLVRDYIPVVKDNVGYMYDKVQQKLYANAGTGSFVAGPEV